MRRAGRIAICAALMLVVGHADARATSPAGFDWDRGSGRIALQGPGGLVLSESGRETTGSGGRLGFQTAAGWFHATRVVAERQRRERPIHIRLPKGAETVAVTG
jgi:hypothetical protein